MIGPKHAEASFVYLSNSGCTQVTLQSDNATTIMAPVLVKSLSRLSRSSLIDLALRWLQQNSQCQPYLCCNRTINESEEEDYLFTPAEDVDELREIYDSLRQNDKATSKGHVIDRILDGDWRRGLSLHQLAMVDLAYLEQHDTALRWSALRLAPLDDSTASSTSSDGPPTKKRKVHHERPDYPSISPSSFAAALKSEISPLVKAHYHLHRLQDPYSLAILRLYISPNSTFAPRSSAVAHTPRHAVDPGRILYIALPDSCPYVYISVAGSANPSRGAGNSRDKNGRAQAKVDMASMKRIILGAIPKAMSRPHERWALEQTNLTAKSLKAICELRGNGKPGTSGGAYSSLVSDQHDKMDTSPVEVMPTPQTPASVENRASTTPGLQKQIDMRFGSLGVSQHARIDRFHTNITDVLRPSDSARSVVEAAPISLSFSGSDVFFGLKQLAELGSGYIDLSKMPSWMTGELGISSCCV